MLALSLFSQEPSYNQLIAEQPLKDQVIVVDPGHGGQDRDCDCYEDKAYTGGTFGAYTKQSESDVNLRVSYYLKNYLEAMGSKVILTRTTRCRITKYDSAESELGSRVEIANRANADLFVSIHHNDSNKPNVNYSCVFYDAPFADESSKLAKHVLYNISRDLRVPMLGVAQGNYRVLKGLEMPGLLVEASFMSNPEEDRRLGSYCWSPERNAYYYAYNDREAYAIAKGIAIDSMSDEYKILTVPQVKDISEAFRKNTKKPAKKPAKKSTSKKSKKKK